MKCKRLLIALFFVLVSSFVHAQEYPKVGLSGSLQGSQFGVQVPVWVGEKTVIAPAFEFKFAEKVGTDIGIALTPRFYFQKKTISPYIGFRIGALINKPYSHPNIFTGTTEEESTTYDFLGGLAFGGEYFLADHFSFGVELQANMTKSDPESDRFGNPGKINVNTGTMLIATVYF